MNKLFKFILPIGIIPILAGCGGKSGNVTHYVTFHQELADDVKVEFNQNTTDGEIIAQEPSIVAKDGYSAKWEDYTVVGKTADFTVNAIYTEYTYTVTFKQKGLVVATVPFAASDVKGEHPKLPAEKTPKCESDTWYTYKWEEYELALHDVVVNAVQDEEIQHIAKFTDGDHVIADNVAFTRNDVDANYKLKDEKIPEDVKNYHHDSKHPTYWDNNWDFTVPTGSDINVTFDANVTKHDFEINFLDHDGNIIETGIYQCDTKWEDMKKPDVSGYEGYDCKWPEEHTFSFDVATPDSVSPDSVAHTHTLTFEGKAEDQPVTYDQPFTLKFADDTNGDLKMWYDQDGNPIPTSGDKWKVDKDLTLHLEEVKEVDFDNGYIPKFMSTDTSKGNSLKVIDNPKGEGKVLEISVAPSTDSAYLILSKEYLTQAFNTDGIKAIEFDAMATSDSINFRSRYKAYRSDQQKDAFFSNPYEVSQDGLGLGISKDRYKTFSFIKEYFTDKDSYEPIGGESGIKFIYGNFGKTGQKLYIKNIRLSTADQVDYEGFEGGGLNFNSSLYQFFYNTGGRGDYPNNRVPHYIANKKYMFVTDEKKTSDSSVTLTNEVNNGGITSLKIHKIIPGGSTASAFPCYISGYGNSNPFYNNVSAVTFDIYCNTRYNGNSIKDGRSGWIPGFSATDFHEANTWYTMTLQISDTNSTADGRFFYMAGGLEADFYLDNIKITYKS